MPQDESEIGSAPGDEGAPTPEQAVAAWICEHVGGTVTSLLRQGRWRPAWYADVDRGGEILRLYVRGDRGHGFSFPLEREVAVLELFERHGIPVPHVHGVMDDPKAIVMDLAPGERQLSAITDLDAQNAVIDDYLGHLTRIHQIPLSAAAAAGIELPISPEDVHLVFHRTRSATYRRLKSRPEPMVEFAMRWLARNVPTHRDRRALATVDAGQFLVAESKVTAIYDLELVHVTDPQADLAGLRIRNAMEPLGDLARAFGRYAELSGDAVDAATVNFHTVVFALSANQAIARLRTQGGRDYVQYYTWEVAGSLFALSALAEEVAVAMPPAPAPRASPAEVLSDSLIDALSLWDPPEDQYERSLAVDLIEHLRLVRVLGPELDAEHVDDVASLVGRRAASAAAADADLEEFVLSAGPERDADITRVLIRRAGRQRLLIPPMSPESAAPGAVGPHIDRCRLAPMSSLLPLS